jgi:hypothetical protein
MPTDTVSRSVDRCLWWFYCMVFSVCPFCARDLQTDTFMDRRYCTCRGMKEHCERRDARRKQRAESLFARRLRWRDSAGEPHA